MKRDASMPMKKVKMNINPIKSRSVGRKMPPKNGPQRFMTKSIEELNFAEPDMEFEHIKNEVNDLMKQMGLNYGWERTGKAVDKAAYFDGKMRYSDSGSANPYLQDKTLSASFKSNAMLQQADQEQSFESKVSAFSR